jgi:hypothetical protein
MNGQRICPFYGGQDIDCCDIGSGYISPYHVEITIRYCIARYDECPRCQRLMCGPSAEESISTSHPLPVVSPCFVDMPSGGLLLPPLMTREEATLFNHLLCTPLTSIRSFVEILLSGSVDDHNTRQRFLKIIHQEAVHLERILDRLFGNAEVDATLSPTQNHLNH